MKKKILLNENIELANNHIENVKVNFLQSLDAIAHEIINLGIGTPTKELIVDALYNDCVKIDAICNDIPTSDALNIHLDLLLKNQIDAKLAQLHSLVSDIKTRSIYTGAKVGNPALSAFFEVDESGKPFLLDSYIEAIKEEVKVYIVTPIGVKLTELQHNLVQVVQNIYNLCHKVDESETQQLPFAVKQAMIFQFPLGLLDIKEERGTDKLIFKARSINFDPEPRENDDIDINIDEDEDLDL